MKHTLGIDIGSTTTKVVLMAADRIVYQKYRRHLSRVRQSTLEMLREMQQDYPVESVSLMISGSAGMGMADAAGLPFIQEVYATGEVVRQKAPDTGVVIELGGEDAKVIFFKGGIDERMNGTCAGGTGAFIDQMAVLLNMTVDEMDAAALQATRLYPIASRCGVFAKTDIQPLLNQGASKADIAASIFQAVVNQTITGLVQGRRIEGKVMFLGGPLYYNDGLKKRFYETLKLTPETAIFPDYALYAVAMGAALTAKKTEPIAFAELLKCIEDSANKEHHGNDRLPPLFENEADHQAFIDRHAKAAVPMGDLESYHGTAWIGIDCGSTTTKLVVIGENKSILYSYYSSNQGDPVALVREQLAAIRKLCADRVTIGGCAVTGYGEDLIRHAFHADKGIVETIAHYTAAKYFRPDVDFILDIGGQDIKCFKIRGGAIDSIMLNEACSSGCGSFIETFARSMGYEVAEFARLGTYAAAPVNLGSRCTVFMNSSVKQSQKDGATVEDISAGLSVSVVKNAIYKVIRAVSPKELGEHIVVQGGTFYNDAVLRAFENEIGANVIRPTIAGLMGAYGAALNVYGQQESTLLTEEALANFTHTSTTTICKGCANGCHLTINRFSDGERLISGNQCQKALGIKAEAELPNLYEWKRSTFKALAPVPGKRGKLGLPMALGMYELAPLWHAVFTDLGYEVIFSEQSKRSTYEKGQFTIPSDTACYPAKIMHGHILELIEKGITRIFYPSLTYNVDEKAGNNHYNCPIVAYYPELLKSNMEVLSGTRDEGQETRMKKASPACERGVKAESFDEEGNSDTTQESSVKVNFEYPYLNINNENAFVRTLYRAVRTWDPSVTRVEIRHAVKAGMKAYDAYRTALKQAGADAMATAREKGKRIMVLAGRPYHIDPEIGHGIDKLATSLGFAVITEDSIAHLAPIQYVHVLDQWTFHARLYRAADYVGDYDDMELVQLVSFGCGVDAITTDEVRRILENKGKYYTQIKIDEITNLGAVKIRLRSLIGALEN